MAEDKLSTPERRRLEALALAINMAGPTMAQRIINSPDGKHGDLTALLRIADTFDSWIDHGGVQESIEETQPMPAGSQIQADKMADLRRRLEEALRPAEEFHGVSVVDRDILDAIFAEAAAPPRSH